MVNEARTLHVLTAFLLIGIYAAGVLTGVAVYRWVSLPETAGRPPWGPPPGPPGPPSMPPEWPLLGFTPEQEAQARIIADKHRPDLEAVIKGTFPTLRAIDKQMEEELRAILRPEQQKKLDQLKAKRPPGIVPGAPPPGLMPPPPPPPPPAPPPPPHPPGLMPPAPDGSPR